MLINMAVQPHHIYVK